ncbi:putative calcium-binding protein CML45 [Heracleum sosnowskyi]|uniref:Calcium-binding protein CML45 n=1 Tax=Heracleum sosnowskyi TaxID=360622 RepID=A0AAD8GQK1_9APIA|nr:putative calcium-binding protein CML45 [Heracleum sosnowskyi]
MSLISYLDQFPMEELSLSLQNIPFSVIIIGLVEFVFFQLSMNWVERVYKYFSRSFSSIQYQTAQVGKMKQVDLDMSKRNACDSEIVDDRSLCIEDMEMVLERLGMFCHPCEDTELHERFGVDYFSSLFEENEPSLDEVKKAFDLYDLNRDGYIDTMELQTVLRALGLNDISQIENCKQMINEFDENRDGRIDFREFVKLMENSFC